MKNLISHVKLRMEEKLYSMSGSFSSFRFGLKLGFDDTTVLNLISRQKSPNENLQDKLILIPIKSKIFSVKTAYLLLSKVNSNSSNSEPVWNLLWISKLHERHKIFIWRMLSNVLPVSNNLQRFVPMSSNECNLCGREE